MWGGGSSSSLSHFLLRRQHSPAQPRAVVFRRLYAAPMSGRRGGRGHAGTPRPPPRESPAPNPPRAAPGDRHGGGGGRCRGRGAEGSGSAGAWAWQGRAVVEESSEGGRAGCVVWRERGGGCGAGAAGAGAGGERFSSAVQFRPRNPGCRPGVPSSTPVPTSQHPGLAP